jgi:hypothetical protein
MSTTVRREAEVAFPGQQWLHERATMLCYTYVAYLVYYMINLCIKRYIISFCSLSYDRSVASSKASSPQGAI